MANVFYRPLLSFVDVFSSELALHHRCLGGKIPAGEVIGTTLVELVTKKIMLGSSLTHFKLGGWLVASL